MEKNFFSERTAYITQCTKLQNVNIRLTVHYSSFSGAARVLPEALPSANVCSAFSASNGILLLL